MNILTNLYTQKMLFSQKISTMELSIAPEREKTLILEEMYDLSDNFKGKMLQGRIVALENNGNYAYYIIEKVGPVYCDLMWIPSQHISPMVINGRCYREIVRNSLEQSDYFRNLLKEKENKDF